MNQPTLVALHWDGDQLVPDAPLRETRGERRAVTILHTNDFHSCIDGPGHGRAGGGLARIATTIRRAREHGPTIVVDAGDSVFGSPTVWCTQGAGATGRLRGVAGYQLAAIGNHDLEHGAQGLRELLEGGYRLVVSDIRFADTDLQQQIAPAYAADIGGWRIGFTGVTTPDTVALVPSRLLEGIKFIDTFGSTVRTVRALEPHVDAIVVLSHLGYDQAELIEHMPHGEPPTMMDQNDSALVPHLNGTKVVAILGGHTHDALEPAPLIGGIAVCNAGAYGVKVGEVRLELGSDGTVNVRTRLLDQDASVGEDANLVAARETERLAFAGVTNDSVRVPEIESGPLRQYRLLAQALKASGKVSASSIMLVPRLYLLGDLPEVDSVRQADIQVAYPSIESLVELTVAGAALKGLLEMQAKLMFFAAAAPLLLEDGREIRPADLEEGASYTVVTSELIAEGGLFWTALPQAAMAVRDLEASCAELVWAYLTKQPVLVEASA